MMACEGHPDAAEARPPTSPLARRQAHPPAAPWRTCWLPVAEGALLDELPLLIMLSILPMKLPVHVVRRHPAAVCVGVARLALDLILVPGALQRVTVGVCQLSGALPVWE